MPRRLSPLLAVLAVLAVAPATIAHAAVPRLAPRIVGGNPVTPATAFAPMAAIVVRAALSDTGVSCGGTVIAPYAVLTAAHCFEVPSQATPAQLMVVTGKTDLSAAGGQHLDIRAIVQDPLFDPQTFDHDVAVVLLQTPTSAPAAVRPTGPPPDATANATGAVFGWGATQTDGTGFPATLQTATVPILNPIDCPNSNMICAGTSTPNVCIGDSGGPLLFNGTLIGITSTVLMVGGQVCGADSSQFTNVFAAQAFINAQLTPSVSGVAVAAISPTRLRVSWQMIPGGGLPTVTVTANNDPTHPRTAPAGATSLDLTGLPAGTGIQATVQVVNTWGSAQATSTTGATLTGVPGLPGVTGAGVAGSAISAQVVTNGAAATVTAQYGLDTVHLTTTAVRQLADAATTQRVSFPLTGLLPARTYRVHVVARSAGGTTTSPWLTFTTPAVKPASRSLPKLRGTARVGRTLTCTSGAWRGAPLPRLTYRWRIGTKVSPRFTTSRLRLTTAMRGKKVACVVTARNVAGSVTVRSAAVTVRRR